MNDTIYRRAALDAVAKLYAIHGSEGSWVDQKDALKALRALPSAEPQRKKGKWIAISDGYVDMVKCDQCGKIADGISDFCPNCGADMKGEQE